MTNFVSTAAWALARKEKSLFKNKAKVTEFCDRRSDSQRSSPNFHFSSVYHSSCNAEFEAVCALGQMNLDYQISVIAVDEIFNRISVSGYGS